MIDRSAPWWETTSLPGMLRHARATYGQAMRQALDDAGYGDIPANGLYLIGGLAVGEAADTPLGQLIRDLGISKQAAGQLVDTLVSRGYLDRAVDEGDRRKLNVTLTGRGRAAAEAQTRGRDAIDAELLARTGADDLHRTRKTIAILCDIGRQRREPSEPEDGTA